MMKISKPILTNEFLLSPVQFTSLNSVVFKNVKSVYEGSDKISLEYEHSAKIEPSSRDWIGIFPRGWSTLQQYMTFEWVSQSLPSPANEQNKENGELIRRMITFYPKYHMSSVNTNNFYQFVYVSKQIEVLGVSSYYRFDATATNPDANLEVECLVPVSNKIRSTSVSDFGLSLTNNISSSTSIDGRPFGTNSIHSLQNMETEGKNWPKPQIPINIAEVKKTSIFPRKPTGTGDALDPYSSHSEPVFPMSFQMSHCKKCFHFKRGGEFLRSQQVLQSKVGPRSSEEASEIGAKRRTLGLENLSKDKLKIVMERNKVLEERVQEMKKEMERLQAESKKIKMSFYSTNKEKVAYEKFVKDFIKSLEKDSIVRVVNGNTEILVKKVNYVGMEEHPRDKKTSKRERELKAVIGLQEITIRNLINSLQEKAKSVQELNQTVKLAQVFSASREDTRNYGSDVEEVDEASNSDVTSEYEFSLTKPQPPEEVTVEDTDTVLDDIRRATEMELKDIGISRSLRKSSSRNSESESGMPSLSVHSYQNQSDSTKPKKPRLFDNPEDCWPYPNETNKIIRRKVIESCSNMEDEIEKEQAENEENQTNDEEESEPQPEESEPSDFGEKESEPKAPIPEIEESTNFENYYDACEGFNASKEVNGEALLPEEPEEMAVVQEKFDNEKKENSNFLVTAIIPQNLDVEAPATKSLEDWLRVEKEEPVEKNPGTRSASPEKGQKFTCELSIDFAAKVRQPQNQVQPAPPVLENENLEEPQNQISESFDSDGQVNRDAPLLTFRKSNKCLKIQITPKDQKENPRKNFVHQKMVVTFGKESQGAAEVAKSSKLEFNLAVSSVGDKLVQAKSKVELPELKSSEGQPVEMEVSPRTVWNDASDDFAEDEISVVNQEEVPDLPEVLEEKKEEALDEPEEKTEGDSSDAEQDSLRYEKNLEFLQQKTEEKVKDNDVNAKDKPTAILIQNGQTKLALIRYQ